MSEDIFKALEANRNYFLTKMSIDKMYANPNIYGPMNLWLFEMAYQQCAILEKQADLLKEILEKLNGKTT